MSPSGRPLVYPTKKLIGFTDEMLAEIAEWQSKWPEIDNFSDAVRALVETGLASGAKKKRKG